MHLTDPTCQAESPALGSLRFFTKNFCFVNEACRICCADQPVVTRKRSLNLHFPCCANLIAQVGHDLGDVRVAGLAVAADGNELDIARTGLLNGAAGDQALAVGQLNDLAHDARVVRTGSDFIVLEPGIQGFEVEFLIDQLIQCEGESAGDNLLRQDHGQHQAVEVLWFGAGHGVADSLR